MMYTYILATLIGIVFPVFSSLSGYLIDESIKANEKNRLRNFVAESLLNVGFVLLIVYGCIKQYPPHLDFYPHFTALGIIATVLVAILVLILYLGISSSEAEEEDSEEEDVLPQHILPKTTTEFYWYAANVITQAVAHELMFRLYLFEFLKVQVGFVAALILCNVAFVINNSSFGKLEILTTFSTGLFFSALYVNTENIWIPIFLHLTISMFGGMLFNKELLMKERS